MENFKKEEQSETFEDLQRIVDSAFEPNNESRKNKGLPPLTRQEYIDSFVQMSKDAVESRKKYIVEIEKQIEYVKKELESKPKDIETIRQSIKYYVEHGSGKEKIEDTTKLLNEFEATFGEDSLLDHLSELKREREKYEKWLKEAEHRWSEIEKNINKFK